jgi:hypothetical protein
VNKGDLSFAKTSSKWLARLGASEIGGEDSEPDWTADLRMAVALPFCTAHGIREDDGGEQAELDR